MRHVSRIGITVAVAISAFVTNVGPSAATVAPQGLARGTTTVTLDQGTIGAVVGLGLTPAAVKPGVLGTHGGDLLAAFPVVGNMKGGVIKHTGGLSLSAGGDTLLLTNYAIDLRDENHPVLRATATWNGDELGRITLFDLGPAPSGFSCGGVAASLWLDAQAAGALHALFDAPDLTGAHFGTACVVPR
jgi:hypothetical protein